MYNNKISSLEKAEELRIARRKQEWRVPLVLTVALLCPFGYKYAKKDGKRL